MRKPFVSLRQHPFAWFVARFLFFFGFFYLGSLAVIGLAAEGGLYSKIVDKYLDVISWITHSLVAGTRGFVLMLGYETYTLPGFIVRIVNGTGVRIAYDCVGYGVMSFWAAFVLATAAKRNAKFKWLLGGLLLLWTINVVRIGLLLIAYNKKWEMPFGIDHHTWFNIVAYTAIFSMMYLFDRNSDVLKASGTKKSPQPGQSSQQKQIYK